MQQPSQWGLLFDAAIATIQHAERQIGGRFLWSLGGGTALMLQSDHRESHDVDLFIDDVQVMRYLNPLTQEYDFVWNPDDYDTDGSRVTKLIYHDVGEIDLICCGDALDDPNAIASIRGLDIRLERPAETLAIRSSIAGPHCSLATCSIWRPCRARLARVTSSKPSSGAEPPHARRRWPPRNALIRRGGDRDAAPHASGHDAGLAGTCPTNDGRSAAPRPQLRNGGLKPASRMSKRKKPIEGRHSIQRKCQGV